MYCQIASAVKQLYSEALLQGHVVTLYSKQMGCTSKSSIS